MSVCTAHASPFIQRYFGEDPPPQSVKVENKASHASETSRTEAFEASEASFRSFEYRQLGGDNPMTQAIDLPAVKSDLAAGASLKETARKHGVPESTLRGRLRKAHVNGSSPKPRTVREKTEKANGATRDGEDFEALAEFLDGQWKRLTLLQRIRCLLTLN
jgi:hypothetical protein